MALLQIDDYTSNLRGVGLRTLALWRFQRDLGIQPDKDSEMLRTGKMAAYASVLLHITGRRIGTQESLVAEIVEFA